MRVTIIGTGYVGLPSGACLAKIGHQVTCLDTRQDVIDGLNAGKIHIHELKLEELVKIGVQTGRLSFTSSYAEAIPGADVISIAVGTPSADDGSVDMQYMWAAAEAIGAHLAGYAVIADKSTVPVGTGERVERIIRERSGIEADVVSNPEFLREGTAVDDFQKPHRIIVGAETERAAETMRRLYRKIKTPVVMDRRSAELVKYASNAFLATKISFANEMAKLCELVGADITKVTHGMGLDERIGELFLKAGLGYGGSCFPKDVKAICHLAAEHEARLPIVEAASASNLEARTRIITRMERALGTFAGKTICVLGIAFKGDTDDTRESPAVDLIKALLERGATVRAFDPVAELPVGIEAVVCASEMEAAQGADVVLVATKWDQFSSLDLAALKSAAKGDLLVDARNIFETEEVKRAGWRHLSVGRTFTF
ncbi:MAG: UDP-glucose/GDP-mannose dehydrogenase family protein [Patescibacteria group bacterium]